MAKIICKNCGWENDKVLNRCLKCNELLHNESESGCNHPDSITPESSVHSDNSSKSNNTLIWRYKSVFYYFAIISTISVVIVTVILYSYYGPLTPNGNRYHHSFDLLSVPFYLILLASLAMAILYYPMYKLYKSNSPNNFKFGIFPISKSITGKVISVLLTILNIGSGIVFTISFILISFEYVCNSNRVMTDDLETIILTAGYIGCMIFWGIVDLVYTIIFKRNW